MHSGFSKLSLHVQRLKEKDSALRKAQHDITSRDKVITELRLSLLAAERRPLADIAKHDDREPDIQPALKLAHETIKDLQALLDIKEDALKRCNNLLTEAIKVHHLGFSYYSCVHF